MRNILSREEFINEGLINKTLKRIRTGEERIEDKLGHHTFVDGNGKTHKYGIEPASLNDLIELIIKVILRDKMKDVIDLNIIDMSNVPTICDLFTIVFQRLNSQHDFTMEFCERLNLDTSGWDLKETTEFRGALSAIKKDIGVNNWKVYNKVKLDCFARGYYQDHLPDWYKFNVKEWIALCVHRVSAQKSGVDKELSKKLGKKMYWVEFNTSVEFPYIPDNVIIRAITNTQGNTHINATNLTSLKKLPTEILCTKTYGEPRIFLEVCLDIIEDDEIIIPKGVTRLRIEKSDDITRLPKDLPCGMTIENQNQLGHLTSVDGDFNVGNSRITSLVGCPKTVSGEMDAHNTKITDLVGAPEHIGGDFSCSNTSSLHSLKGCPKTVGGDFNIYSTGLVTLDDFPESIGGNINMSGCTHLESFKGLPKHFKGDLDIGYCNTQSLEGLPEEIDGTLIVGDLTLNNEHIKMTELQKICKAKAYKYSSYNYNPIKITDDVTTKYDR